MGQNSQIKRILKKVYKQDIIVVFKKDIMMEKFSNIYNIYKRCLTILAKNNNVLESNI